jgi:hypothetical protein
MATKAKRYARQEFPCETCGRILWTPGGRGSHQRKCRPVMPVDNDEGTDLSGNADWCLEDDVLLGVNGDREDDEAPMDDGEEEFFYDAEEDAVQDDMDDGDATTELPPLPAVDEATYVFYHQQINSGAASIRGPLQRIQEIDPPVLRIVKAFWNPLVNLSAAAMRVMLALLKDPLFNSHPQRVPGLTKISKQFNAAVSREQDPVSKREKKIDLRALNFPDRFTSVVFSWTCIIALCVELLLDPRISKSDNMDFKSTYDGMNFGELPSGAWWAGEEVNMSNFHCIFTINTVPHNQPYTHRHCLHCISTINTVPNNTPYTHRHCFNCISTINTVPNITP